MLFVLARDAWAKILSASGSPLTGQPPEMRSRAPLFSGEGAAKNGSAEAEP